MKTPLVSVTSLLSSYARNCNCEMEWRGAPIRAEDVFENSYLMPVVTTLATIKGASLLGWGLDVRNEPAKEGLLGLRSEIPMFMGAEYDDQIRGLFYIHAAEKVFGLSRGGVIECYPVFEFFRMDLNRSANQVAKYKQQQPVAVATQRSQTS